MWNNQIMYPISVYSSLHADLLGTLALTSETRPPSGKIFGQYLKIRFWPSHLAAISGYVEKHLMFYWHNIAGRNTARDGQCVCVCVCDKKTISNGIHHNNILSHFLCVIFARLDYPNSYFYLWTDMKKCTEVRNVYKNTLYIAEIVDRFPTAFNGTRFRRNHLSNVF